MLIMKRSIVDVQLILLFKTFNCDLCNLKTIINLHAINLILVWLFHTKNVCFEMTHQCTQYRNHDTSTL